MNICLQWFQFANGTGCAKKYIPLKCLRQILLRCGCLCFCSLISETNIDFANRRLANAFLVYETDLRLNFFGKTNLHLKDQMNQFVNRNILISMSSGWRWWHWQIQRERENSFFLFWKWVYKSIFNWHSEN